MQIRINSGIYKGRRINLPNTGLRPTSEKVRCAFFDTLFSMINFENRDFLDIFSGTGAMSFEALSRGFKKAVAIDSNAKSIFQITENAELLGTEKNIHIIQKDAFCFNSADFLNSSFSAIYIDPPYKMSKKMPELIENIILTGMPDNICVIGVETGNPFNWQQKDWNIKRKNFGDTFLTFLYNWG